MATRRKPESPPPDLDRESKQLWKVAYAQLVADHGGTFPEAMLPTLERYVRAAERGRLARKLATKEGLTVVGSQGQPVQNPNLKTAREAEQDAHRYATDLLLTPASRKRREDPKATGAKGPFDDAF